MAPGGRASTAQMMFLGHEGRVAPKKHAFAGGLKVILIHHRHGSLGELYP